MTIEELREELPSYAKDINLNLGTVLTPEGAPDLTVKQIYGIALASAYATKSNNVISAMLESSQGIISESEIEAAKAAATIMAMNNIYYRFIHLVPDEEIKKMPAKLRMSIIGQPGIEKVDFELYALAVSAINGCGMCMEAHVHQAEKANISKLGIQSTIRIAAVINAVAQAGI